MATQGSATLPKAPTTAGADDRVQIPGPLANGQMQQQRQILSAIVQLMMYSPLHRQYTVSEIEQRFMPSLVHNQFRYYSIDGSPIGFVNWAWIDDAIEPQYQTGKYELRFDEWKGGAHLWFPEMIAPFGHARQIAKDLRTNIFPGVKLGKSLRLSPEGKFRTGIYRR